MAEQHTVVQGEHVTSIAAFYGFRDYRTIWDHPENARLRSLRHNPNVLLPGDIVFIPDLEPIEAPRSTDQKHQFVLSRPPLKLRIQLENQYGQPVVGAPCVLVLDSDSKSLTSDGTGKVECTIPPSIEDSSLIIEDSEHTHYANTPIPVKIGHLDPETELRGQQARLKNLGYFPGEVNGEPSEDFQSAVEEFQCENALTVDGICGPKTQAKLKQVCGC